MRIPLLVYCIIFGLHTSAQSPALGINLSMNTVKAGPVRYKIEMKICEPRKKTDRGDWFARDTSVIDFTAISTTDINCEEYMDQGLPTLIPSPDEEIFFNRFKFAGQVFAWEKIIIFRISDLSSRNRQPQMYILIPMKYKSFRTTIDIRDIIFQPGTAVFLKDIRGSYGRNKLSFSRSLVKIKGVEVNSFPLKGIL